MIRNFLTWLRHLRFLQLTIFFIFVLLTLPFRTDHPLLNMVVQLLLLNIFVVTLSLSGSKRLLQGLMAGFWSAGEILYLRLMFGSSPANQSGDVAAVVVCFMVMMTVCVIAILPYIYHTRQVTLDTIFAAVMAYFFISCIFANMYTLLYLGNPDSFNLPPTTNPDIFYSLYTELLYFSLITIVGVGYGDIIPLLPFPRMLAAIEGVLGNFYIAVFVAWLVGTFISQSLQREEKRVTTEVKKLIEEE